MNFKCVFPLAAPLAKRGTDSCREDLDLKGFRLITAHVEFQCKLSLCDCNFVMDQLDKNLLLRSNYI